MDRYNNTEEQDKVVDDAIEMISKKTDMYMTPEDAPGSWRWKWSPFDNTPLSAVMEPSKMIQLRVVEETDRPDHYTVGVYYYVENGPWKLKVGLALESAVRMAVWFMAENHNLRKLANEMGMKIMLGNNVPRFDEDYHVYGPPDNNWTPNTDEDVEFEKAERETVIKTRTKED